MNGKTRDRVSLMVLLLMAVVAVWLMYQLLVPFLKPIMFAVVLTIAFQPLYQWISAKLRPRALAALATTLLLLTMVVVPLGILTVTIANEAHISYLRLAGQSAQEGGWGTYAINLLDPPVQWVAAKTGINAPDIRDLVLSRAKSLSADLVSWGASLLANLTSTLTDGILSLLVMFFLFLEGPAIHDGILKWMPLARQRTQELLDTIADAIVANVYGIAAVGAAQGILTGLAFWFTGLNSPVMWGAVAGLCSLLPIVGSSLVWIPGALVLLFLGSWGKALFLVLWGVFAIGIVDNIVRPWILSGRTEMNTLVVFFALMGGIQAFGFIGLFAGPVIFSVAIAIFRILREEFDQAHSPDASSG